MPPGALASSRIATAGDRGERPRSARGVARGARPRPRRVVRRRGSRRRGRRSVSADDQQQQQAAERLAGVDAHGQRRAVRRSARPARTPTRRAAPSRPARRRASRARAARSGTTREPQREPDRRPRAATPREKASSRHTISSPSAGPGEHVDRGVAGAARGEPQHRRDAERGGQADAVPVVERRAQPRERLVRRERAREDLGQQRPRHSSTDASATPPISAPSARARAGRARARPRAPRGRRACGWSPATTRRASATS